jgi:hypothetical protein
MIYTIIAEGRCGGQSLLGWLNISLKNEYIIANEPFRKGNNIYTKDTSKTDFSWLKENKNYIIKELNDDNSSKTFKPLLDLSDKIICIYRENWKEQLYSQLYGQRTKRWHTKYTIEQRDKLISENDVIEYYNNFYKEKKEKFQYFIKENNLESITYEELYYNNGIEKIKKYFNIESNIEFPFGQRYLTNENFLL